MKVKMNWEAFISHLKSEAEHCFRNAKQYENPKFLYGKENSLAASIRGQVYEDLVTLVERSIEKDE